MRLTMIATCLFGLEKHLGEEIDALGGHRLDTMDGRISFEGDETVLARANVGLRCAERVFLSIGRFSATTFDELFCGVRALPWEAWIGRNDAFPVKGHAIKSQLFSVPDCQSIIKKAIASRLGERYGVSWLPEDGVTYQVEFFLFKDVATLMIDTTGQTLHKRGYRPASGAAPLRETLAAAMVMMARPREDVLLWDPFCGSGTIAIEAAMMMRNIAPGMSRSFAAERFAAIGKTVFDRAREEAQDAVKRTCAFEAWGSDIDGEVLALAQANAQRAGVADAIRFFCADATAIKKPDRRGTIVCNPPYGERLMSVSEAENLYRRLGRTLAGFDPWQIYVLTSCETFQTLFGRRADKVRKLYNGMIPCGYYQFFRPQASHKDGQARTSRQ